MLVGAEGPQGCLWLVRPQPTPLTPPCPPCSGLLDDSNLPFGSVWPCQLRCSGRDKHLMLGSCTTRRCYLASCGCGCCVLWLELARYQRERLGGWQGGKRYVLPASPLALLSPSLARAKVRLPGWPAQGYIHRSLLPDAAVPVLLRCWLQSLPCSCLSGHAVCLQT